MKQVKIKVMSASGDYVHVWNEDFPLKPFEAMAGFDGCYWVPLSVCAEIGGADPEVADWDFCICFLPHEVEVIEEIESEE